MRYFTPLVCLTLISFSLAADEASNKDPRLIKLEAKEAEAKKKMEGIKEGIAANSDQKNKEELSKVEKKLRAAIDVKTKKDVLANLQQQKSFKEIEINNLEQPSGVYSTYTEDDILKTLKSEKANLEINKIPQADRELKDAENTLLSIDSSINLKDTNLQETIRNLEKEKQKAQQSADGNNNTNESLDQATKQWDSIRLQTIKAYDPIPIVDWINITQIKSFFSPEFFSIPNREEYFNCINSLTRYYIDIQPYGFSSKFDLGEDSFKLNSIGVAVQGGLSLNERWILGGGVGYWHSKLDYKIHFENDYIGNQNDVSNSLYAGPFVAYLFDRGYLQLRAIGVYNSYSREEEPKIGWDFDATLEGGLNFEIKKFIGPCFFVQPNIKVDYLMVFQDENESTKSVHVNQANFLSSRVAVQFLKEFHQNNQGIIIPSLSAGWVLMQPLSQSSNCADRFESINYKSSNQAYVGASLTGIHKSGILLSLGFDAYIAKLYPVYAYNLKLSFQW